MSYGTPPAWPLSEQELSDSRYLYVATDPNEPDSANVVLTIQPLRADYSALGSFGTIGLVGASLMPQCITGGGGFSGPANGMCTMDVDGTQPLHSHAAVILTWLHIPCRGCIPYDVAVILTY